MSHVFNSPPAQEAIRLYHRRMREAHDAKRLKVDTDPVVQFALAGLEVRRQELLLRLGFAK